MASHQEGYLNEHSAALAFVPGIASTQPTSQELVSQELDFTMPAFDDVDFANFPAEGFACLENEVVDSTQAIQQLSSAVGKDYDSMTVDEQANWSFLGRLIFSSFLTAENRGPVKAMLGQLRAVPKKPTLEVLDNISTPQTTAPAPLTYLEPAQEATIGATTSDSASHEIIEIGDDSEDDRPLQEIREEQLALAAELLKRSKARSNKMAKKAKKARKALERWDKEELENEERVPRSMGGKYPAPYIEHLSELPLRQQPIAVCDCSKAEVVPGCESHDLLNPQPVQKTSVTPLKHPQTAFTRSFFGHIPRSNDKPRPQVSTSGASTVSDSQSAGPQQFSSTGTPGSQPAQSRPQYSPFTLSAPTLSSILGNRFQNLTFRKYSEVSPKTDRKPSQQKRQREDDPAEDEQSLSEHQNEKAAKYRKTSFAEYSAYATIPSSSSAEPRRSTYNKTVPQSAIDLMKSSWMRRLSGERKLTESSNQQMLNMNNSTSQQLTKPHPFYTQMLGQISHPQPILGPSLYAQMPGQTVYPQPQASAPESNHQSQTSQEKKMVKAMRESDESRSGTWSPHEFDAILYELQKLRADEARRGIPRNRGLRDVRLWTAISLALTKHDVLRTASACKNFWSREGRLKSGFDERANPDPNNLATSVQHPRNSIGSSRP